MTDDRVRELLERSQPQPQALVGDLIATYWPESREAIPSAALVELLADFGFSAASSRTALSRLARRGRMVRTQSGRRTFYRQTEAGARRVAEVRRQVLAFGPEPVPWDGRWLVVAFNVPERERARRHLLRTRLRDLGFRPLYDAVWISPRGSSAQVSALLEEMGVERATVFEAEIPGQVDVASVFGLDELASRYRTFIADFAGLATDSRLNPLETLVVRTIVWDRWREIVQADDGVPAEVLDAEWPRSAAHRLFTQLHAGLEIRAKEHILATMKRVG